MATSPTNTATAVCPADCLGRRTFLATAGSVVASTLGLTFPDRVLAQHAVAAAPHDRRAAHVEHALDDGAA